MDRPAVRKQRKIEAAAAKAEAYVLDDVLAFDAVRGFDDPLDMDDVSDHVVDLARDDEALLAWLNSPAFAAAPPWERTQRELHFHITLQTPDVQRRGDLITTLEQLACTVTTLEAETISGYLAYNPRHYTDRKATAQLHKLLNRWQRKGHLTWSASRKK